MQLLFDILREIPLLAGIDQGDIEVERLNGLLNTNYKLVSPDLCVVVHLAAPGTEAYVNHKTEASNARAAAAAGVAPEVLYSDERRGIIVTRFVNGAAPWDAARASRESSLARIGRKLRDLHAGSEPFANDFNPFDQLNSYVAIMTAHGQEPAPAFLEALAGLAPLRELLHARAGSSAPCHCDPLPENILDDGERLYIIDYEFSGNCDPLYDLGDYSGEADLGEAQEKALLASYFGGAAPAEAHDLLVAYKAVSLLVSCGWSQVQVASGNNYKDFEAYGNVRLARCWETLETHCLQQLIVGNAAHDLGPHCFVENHLLRAREHRDDESETWV